MHAAVLAKHRAAMARVHAHVDGLGLAPWQSDLLILMLDAQMMGLDVRIEVPR